MTEAEDLSLLQLIVLAIIQGVTEFLPISSSAHLILVPALTGWPDQGLAVDVAMHVGTLAAVMLYFRRDVAAMAVGAANAARGRWTQNGRLAFQVAAATIPVVIAGALLKDLIETEFRSASLIAVTTGGFALLLWIADRKAPEDVGAPLNITWRIALLIGVAQALALAPGVSRSGITMTAALLLGLSRSTAARFSLLLSIPTTAAAGALGAADLAQSDNVALQGEALAACVLAFFAAFAAIAGLMAWLRRSTFMPFVIYRLALSALLVALITAGIV